MFKLSQANTFFWPVSISIPVDGGTFKTETFDIEFRRVKRSELESLTKENTEDSFIKAIVVGWKGITDGESEAVFSVSNLEKLLDFPGVPGAISNAFFEALTGQKKTI